MSKPTTMEDLLDLMAKLRDPKQGCPWDLEQTFATIVPHTIEEAYEVQDAIENGTPTDIAQELGDLLFQIVFYCQLGKEKGWFDFATISAALKDKLVRRHPHVFSDSKVTSSGEQQDLWKSYKAQERQEKLKANNHVLANVPINLPALTRAQKLQDRAAQVGFDWPHIDFVIAKVREEIDEFAHDVKAGNIPESLEELGDILFVCANLARHLKSDAETIVRKANTKFERRFNQVEDKVIASGKPWDDYTLEELDRFWDEVKMGEK